ncbi:MAG: HD domain-containing protein, partial [Christensenellaceae bacterium]
ADMIEPERDFPGIGRLRSAAKESLEEAFLLALASPMVYELGRRHIVHPNSLIVYNRLLALKSSRPDGTIMKKEE